MIGRYRALLTPCDTGELIAGGSPTVDLVSRTTAKEINLFGFGFDTDFFRDFFRYFYIIFTRTFFRDDQYEFCRIFDFFRARTDYTACYFSGDGFIDTDDFRGCIRFDFFFDDFGQTDDCDCDDDDKGARFFFRYESRFCGIRCERDYGYFGSLVFDSERLGYS